MTPSSRARTAAAAPGSPRALSSITRSSAETANVTRGLDALQVDRAEQVEAAARDEVIESPKPCAERRVEQALLDMHRHGRGGGGHIVNYAVDDEDRHRAGGGSDATEQAGRPPIAPAALPR